MPDTTVPDTRAPADWGAAFAALPQEAPPADPWPRIAARLAARRSHRWPLGLAAAAVLVLAVVLPLRLAQHTSTSVPATVVAGTDVATLQRLQAESAQLEALLAWARDDSVASGNAVAVAAQLDARVAAIDAALAEPGLSPQRQRTLWEQRVGALRSLTAFEANRRWLVSQGERYDVALVRVD
ncbi:MAG TPA: hypothetical protein VM576_05500 [Xanthomonadaceae bacterium]|nr:hypothetical protein [Xanthomonadaceae bacterium]